MRAGLIKPEQLNDLRIWQMLKESVGWDGTHFSEQTRHRIIRRMLGIEIDEAKLTEMTANAAWTFGVDLAGVLDRTAATRPSARA